MRSKNTAVATKFGIYAAIAVFVIGPICQIIQAGWPTVLTKPAFWLGLYGWLAASIVVGYLVRLGLCVGRKTTRLPSDAIATPNLVARTSPTDRFQSMTATTQQPLNQVPRPQLPAGQLPAWETSDLLAPPHFNFSNILTSIGPGVILLGTSIGSTEWLIGPFVTVEYGGYLLWIASASIILQAVINTEFIRYTLYTAETIYTGFMRTWPGPVFWAIFYLTLAILQLSWPGLALSAATAMTAICINDVPSPENANLVKLFGLLTLLSTSLIIAFGDKIERTMEFTQWFLAIVILLFLIVLGVRFATHETWVTVVTGFVRFGTIPPGVDWVKLGALASSAGAGGIINSSLTNLYRDKGFAMAATVGYIPGCFGGSKVSLSPIGKVFPLTPENKKRWQEWWKFVSVDQYLVWVVGCFLGLGLPALLTLQFIPAGTEFENQLGIAVYQAQYLVREVGYQSMWFITLGVGAAILYSSQLGITDSFSRTVTDIIWWSSRVRAWSKGDTRFVYYTVLALFTLWGGIVILFSTLQPLSLVLLGGNMAGLNFVFLGLHVLYVNRKFLPPGLRAPLWREVIVVLAVLFYAMFFFQAVLSIVRELLP